MKMRRRRRARILSLLLVLSLMFSMLPAGASGAPAGDTGFLPGSVSEDGTPGETAPADPDSELAGEEESDPDPDSPAEEPSEEDLAEPEDPSEEDQEPGDGSSQEPQDPNEEQAGESKPDEPEPDKPETGDRPEEDIEPPPEEPGPEQDSTEVTPDGPSLLPDASPSPVPEIPAEEQTYRASGGGASVTAVVPAEAGFPADAGLTVRRLAPGTEDYENAVADAEAGLGLGPGEHLRFVPFDITFTDGAGAKLEPAAGEVELEMTFSDDVLAELAQAEGETFLVHIRDDGTVERMRDLAPESGTVTFSLTSLSVMGPAALDPAPELDPDTMYAILYEGNQMVFQTGGVVDLDLGEALEVIELPSGEIRFNSKPLSDYAKTVTSISFKDTVRPAGVLSFSGCTELTRFSAEGLDTSQVTSMASLFNNCKKLTSLDLNGWDTSQVTTLESAFYGCEKLTDLQISEWNVENVTTMHNTFSRYLALPDLNIKAWRTPKLTNTGGMFSHCEALTELDLRGWDTHSLTGMSEMFSVSKNLQYCHMEDWDVSHCTLISNMFYQCSSLVEFDMSQWDVSSATSTKEFFNDCKSLTSVKLGAFDSGNVTSTSYMFNGCTRLTDLQYDSWDMHKVSTANKMFTGCSGLKELDVSGWGMESLTDAEQMFYNCSGLTNLDVSTWDVGKLKKATQMFSGCSRLEELDVSSWRPAQVTAFDSMFSGCAALTDLDVSEWTTGAGTTFAQMFSGCKGLAAIDVGGWDMGSAKTLTSMFNNCAKLARLDLSGWDMTSVTATTSMFANCPALGELKLGALDRFPNDTKLEDTWVRDSTKEEVSSEEITTGYDGSTMADTYLRIFRIVFDGNGGTVSQGYVPGYFGMLPEELPAAERHGFTFDGWWTDILGGEPLDADHPLAQTTYYAHWKPNTYTLHLVAQNPEEDTLDVELTYDQFYRLDSAGFTNGDKVLTGWSTHPDGSGTFFAPDEEVCQLTEDAGGVYILYAQWTDKENFAVVRFETGDGEPIDPIVLRVGGTIALPGAEKLGYSLLRWHKDSEDGPAYQPLGNYTVVSDVTFYAEWVKDPVITFHPNGGSPEETQRTVKYNTKIGTLPEFPPYSSRLQSLIGWFTEPVGGTQITADWVAKEDTTLYAHWGWAPRFQAEGGRLTDMPDLPVREDPNYNLESLPGAVRDGFTFDGWYLADGTTKVQPGDTVNLEDGIDIYAHWVPAEVLTLHLDAQGGTVDGKASTDIQVYKGQPVASLPDAVKTGFEFLGWFDDAGNPYDAQSVFEADTTLYAHWSDEQVTVTFNPDGGTGLSASSVKVPRGTTVQVMPGAKKTNFILEGWYTQPEGMGDKLQKDTVITENITYYAHWVPFWLNESDENALYTYGAEWSNASNKNVSNYGDRLDFHPTDNTKQTASLHVRFELNDAIGSHTLPAGSVRIKIPKYVWKDWDGDWTGTDNMKNSLPLWPATRSGMFFSYLEEGDYYILVNNSELKGGTGVDVTITYTATPKDIPGGGMDSNGRYVDGYPFYDETYEVEFDIDQELDGVAETTADKALDIEMHTRVVTSQTKAYVSTLYTWSTSWGPKPADADNYFYVQWRLSETTNSSSTNQPFTFQWSEDTVHDGTVVYMSSPTSSSCTVVTKYPMSLIGELTSEGMTLKNEAIVTETWESGYVTSHRVAAEHVMYPAEYPTGKFAKGRVNTLTISGGQETIIDDNAEVTMPFVVEFSGGSELAPRWDEETNNYVAVPRTIMLEDGRIGDLLYSSGQRSDKYVWEPETGNTELSDNDYYIPSMTISVTEYDGILVNGVWTPPFTRSDKTTASPVKLYVRYSGTDHFVFYEDVNIQPSTVTVKFPEKSVVGFRVTYDSRFYYTDLEVRPTFKLCPTQKVRSLIQSDINIGTTSLIKNIANCKVWPAETGETGAYFQATNYSGPSGSAQNSEYELNISTTHQYTRKYAAKAEKVIINAETGTQDSPMCISGWNYNNSSRLKRIRTGVFYDLLPAGTTVDPATVYGVPETNKSRTLSSSTNLADSYNFESSSKLDASLFDVRFYENWENSQRTMMVISFAIPESISACGANFYYLLHNTYENVMENGTTLENDVAFGNTTTGAVLPADTSDKLTTIGESEYYESLDSRYRGYIGYAKASTNFAPISAFSWGFSKDVKTQTNYSREEEVLMNGTYTYRLTYSQSDYAESSGIVFFDILESGFLDREAGGGEPVFLPSEWQGALVNVNVKSIAEKLTKDSASLRCDPVVYYSTAPRESLDKDDFDVSHSDIWSRKVPANLAEVTAIAVDCSLNTDGSEFVLEGQQAMQVYITLTAPTDPAHIGKVARNEGYIAARQGTDKVQTTLQSTSTVTLRQDDIEVHKTSDPETGTEDAPTIVEKGQVITYTLTLRNKDDTFTLNDLVLTDSIPEGLTVLTEDITVHFGNPDAAVPVLSSPRLKFSREGQDLKFEVSSLLPEETLYVLLPCTVMVEETTFRNQAKVTSVNGMERNLETEVTWHKETEIAGNILPNTGGSGLLPVFLGSVSALTAAWLFLLEERRRRGENG